MRVFVGILYLFFFVPYTISTTSLCTTLVLYLYVPCQPQTPRNCTPKCARSTVQWRANLGLAWFRWWNTVARLTPALPCNCLLLAMWQGAFWGTFQPARLDPRGPPDPARQCSGEAQPLPLLGLSVFRKSSPSITLSTMSVTNTLGLFLRQPKWISAFQKRCTVTLRIFIFLITASGSCNLSYLLDDVQLACVVQFFL